MATHSRILAWRIPWPDKPGGLQSIGLQRVRTRFSMHTHMQGKRTYFFFGGAFQVALVVKNQLANAGDARDASSIPRLGRFLGGGNGTPL